MPPKMAKPLLVPIIRRKSFFKTCRVDRRLFPRSMSRISIALMKAAMTKPIPPPKQYAMIALGIH
jgi:hypothetical protein